MVNTPCRFVAAAAIRYIDSRPDATQFRLDLVTVRRTTVESRSMQRCGGGA